MAKGLSTELRRNPEARTRHIDVATGTQVEHGEKTWTTGQLARDLLQNHLDAQSDIFYSQLVTAVMADLPDTAPEKAKAARNALGVVLWRYKKYLEPTDAKSAQVWLEQQVQQTFKEHPVLKSIVRPEFLKRFGGVQTEIVTQQLNGITEHRPGISYKVTDTAGTPPVTTWLSYQDMQNPDYADVERYVIVGWKMQDAGTGFDAKLQSLYKSTKAKPYQRGRFGEGMKMSHIHALRHKAIVKVRSSYQVNDGSFHIWQSHPVIAPDHSLHVKGVEIAQPTSSVDKPGSATILDFTGADQTFADELRTEIDPRSGGLAKNCLEFSPDHYQYFTDYPEVGISTDGVPEQQAVQGLHIADEISSHSGTIFAYDFLNADILGGRDRRQVSSAAEKEIEKFWSQPLPLELMQGCMHRLVTTQSKKYSILEEDALGHLLGSKKWLFGEAAQKQSRAAEVIVTALMAELGLTKNSRHVLIETKQIDENVIAAAAKLGINVISVERPFSTYFMTELNETLKSQGIILYSSRSFQENALKDTKFAVEHDLALEQTELRNELSSIVTAGRTSVEVTLQQLGLDPGSINLLQLVDYPIIPLDQSAQNPIDMNWDSGKKQFRLIASLPQTADEAAALHTLVREHRGELEQLVAVYCVAAVDQSRPFQRYGQIFEHAQKRVERWHDDSLTLLHPDVAKLPRNFQHSVDTTAAEINPFEKSKKTRPQNLASWAKLRRTRSRQTPLSEMAQILNQQAELAPTYRAQTVLEATNRLDFADDILTYLDTTQPEAKVISRNLTELEAATALPRVVDTLADGRPIVQLSEQQFCLPIHIPDGAVISLEPLHCVYVNGEFYSYVAGTTTDKPVIHPYAIGSDDMIVFQPNALIINVSKEIDPETIVPGIKILAEELTIQEPDSSTPPAIETMPTELRTDLPKEFGQESWNNPVRLVQDIIQNHIDAAHGEDVSIEFEIIRAKKHVWVPASAISKRDTIVGLRISDSGSGYAPHNLHKLGSSSKVSPLFRGKYGEGQKMVAAAAARHGLDLSYDSIVYYEGERTRWRAQTGTVPESVVLRGQPTTVDRVAFQISSQPELASPTTSSTTIRLPDGVKLNTAGQKIWSAIVETIHPLRRDKLGHAGIERYVRTLRKPSDTVIDLGYMKILLDEPGVVYENGLQISTKEKLTVGYDVPSITSTRERNAVDVYRLQQYIETAYDECSDPRFVEALVKKFFKDTWNKLQNHSFFNVPEIDQKWEHVESLHGNPVLLSRPLWDEALSKVKPGVFLHSDEYCSEQLEHARTEEERTEIWTAIHAADRLPKQDSLGVDQHSYNGLKAFIPTSFEIGQAMRGYKVEMSPTTQKLVYDTVAAQADTLQQWLNSTGRLEEAARLRTWSDKATAQTTTDIVLSPLNALALGTIRIDADEDKPVMTLNEQLLHSGKGDRLTATIQHELIHYATLRSDFRPGFISDLLAITRFNLQHGSRSGKFLRSAQNLIREE